MATSLQHIATQQGISAHRPSRHLQGVEFKDMDVSLAENKYALGEF